MFDIGWSELLVIAVVAIVVVGPKDLPKLMRTFGHYAGKLRRAASDFQRQFEEAVRESEIDEVRKAIESVRDQTPSVDLKGTVDKPLMMPKPQAEAAQPSLPAEPPAAPAEGKPAPVKTKTPAAKSPAAKSSSAKRRKAEAEPKP